MGDKVQIEVIDNGNGIPQKVLDKIFQPFLPQTNGRTGLGLSLSYDIIKAHGGEIKVKKKENEGTEFTIVARIVMMVSRCFRDKSGNPACREAGER